MKYVFVDTDNGGTPANATPDTSTSKYHTTASWPANGARWSHLSGPLGDATIRALTDDVTIFCIGATEDTNGASTSNMLAASLLISGNAASPKWDTTKFRIVYTGAVAAALTLTGACASVTLSGVQIEQDGTVTAPTTLVLNPPTSGTYNVNNCIIRQGSTARSNATSQSVGISCSGTGTSLAININNTIVHAIGSTSSVTVRGIRGNTTNAATYKIYNSVVADVTSGGATFIGITANTGDTVTVKNSAVFNTSDDFQNCDTVANCASDDGDGTSAVTGLTWANQFVDYANGDFTLKSGSSLIGAGIGPSSDADVPSTDIAGVTRSGTTTDIGPSIFVAASSPPFVAVMAQRNIRHYGRYH